MRAILTYHSIDASRSPISLDEAAFRRHVEFLASGRVRVVPLEALASVPETESAVALTFDDGFENFATAAWPRLADANLPATVFIVTEHVGRDNRWGGRNEPGIPDVPLMDWTAVAKVAAEGASIGSHTRTHPYLTDLDDARLADELTASRERIAAETGVRPSTFAYPYGVHDARTAAAVAREYASAVTTELRALDPSDPAHLLPRLDAYYLQREGAIEAFGTPAFRRRVARRAMLRKLRSRLTGARRPSWSAADRNSPTREARSL